MSTMAEKVIVAGADNRPSMLEKSQYNSWQSRMLLYIRGKENGKELYNSVINGPFQYVTVEVPATPTTLAYTRDITYDDLTYKEKIHAKEIWDKVKLLIEALGGNIRDMDSILEETGQDCSFTRSGFKNMRTVPEDGVAIPSDVVRTYKGRRQENYDGIRT
ncbi:hypothetical protein Tco_0776324 [Tanacetum coccineum]